MFNTIVSTVRLGLSWVTLLTLSSCGATSAVVYAAMLQRTLRYTEEPSVYLKFNQMYIKEKKTQIYS